MLRRTAFILAAAALFAVGAAPVQAANPQVEQTLGSICGRALRPSRTASAADAR